MDGISALLGFVARRCWSLRYPEIRELAELFRHPYFQGVRDLADTITNSPQQDIYGYLDHHRPQPSATDRLPDPINIPHLDEYGYLEQSLPQMFESGAFAGQINSPQLDVYGYLEHPLPQNPGQNDFVARSNTRQFNACQRFPQSIAPTLGCSQSCQSVGSRLALDRDLAMERGRFVSLQSPVHPGPLPITSSGLFVQRPDQDFSNPPSCDSAGAFCL